MSEASIHTVPAGDGWANRREGGDRASGIVETQADAIAAARDTAQRERLEHFIHGPDGRIRDRSSCGHDPRNRKG